MPRKVRPLNVHALRTEFECATDEGVELVVIGRGSRPVRIHFSAWALRNLMREGRAAAKSVIARMRETEAELEASLKGEG